MADVTHHTAKGAERKSSPLPSPTKPHSQGGAHYKPTLGDKISGTMGKMIGHITHNPTKVAEGVSKRSGSVSIPSSPTIPQPKNKDKEKEHAYPTPTSATFIPPPLIHPAAANQPMPTFVPAGEDGPNTNAHYAYIHGINYGSNLTPKPEQEEPRVKELALLHSDGPVENGHGGIVPNPNPRCDSGETDEEDSLAPLPNPSTTPVYRNYGGHDGLGGLPTGPPSFGRARAADVVDKYNYNYKYGSVGAATTGAWGSG